MKKLLMVLLVASYGLMANDYALIVSISKYKYLKKALDMSQDAKRYDHILDKMGVAKDSRKYLKENNATKKKILNYISTIAGKITANDRFFMFFSGHGIDGSDEQFGSIIQEGELKKYFTNSGAILPVDFNPNDVSGTVIIGKRDLREHFTKIDSITKKALIVFDTCYSKYSVKGENREDKLELLHIDTKDDDYPYDNIVYIAASKSKAKPGRLSEILDSCIQEDTNLSALKVCLNDKSKKSPYTPIVLSKREGSLVFGE